ncbi:hypothetical protein BN2364_3013 [Alloalcanivorax xenomutans]|uniref:hypothetical protein n=1 Tax=Alloalcanivorax xenomutans TaxID=1094342 RepID=UPI0006D5BD7E|nr:hypothetical protein [Alloalcanivorax xenomutans]CUR47454.1 hypothetical protein BN2364_3013 [Alloalcanivorax xenomutans]
MHRKGFWIKRVRVPRCGSEWLSEQIFTVSEAVDSGAERLSIAVRTFMNKARTDPDWTRALITVVRYAHEEMAMSMVISATLGAMNLLVEDGEVEHADRIAAEMGCRRWGCRPKKPSGLLGCCCRGRVNSWTCHSMSG